jgi:3-oxoacyl-[acyl-carrier-protein] synthase II
MRRVVVTGLGAVTPLGVGSCFFTSGILKLIDGLVTGFRISWNRLLAGKSGITSLRSRAKEFEGIPCQVAGLVPHGGNATGGWNPEEWLDRGVWNMFLSKTIKTEISWVG